MLSGKAVRSTVDDKVYNIDKFYNCNTSNVLYVITCGACSIQYVGRTTRRLRDRFREHLVDKRGLKSTNVAHHFNSMHGGDVSLVHMQMVERVKASSRGDVFRLLCKREVFWIFKLRSRIPEGLNHEWDVTHYYEG